MDNPLFEIGESLEVKYQLYKSTEKLKGVQIGNHDIPASSAMDIDKNAHHQPSFKEIVTSRSSY